MAGLEQSVLLAGLGLGAASMLSIGPNNLMLIREGLVRGRVLTVATTVWASYIVLLVSAMALADVSRWVGPSTRSLLSWCGLLTVSWFAFDALRIAIFAPKHGSGERAEETRTCLRRVLMVVWCNPLTYLELLLIPAAFCSTLQSFTLRSEFICAFLAMKGVSCYGYTLGGGLCGSLAGDRRVLRVFDLASGLLLGGVAVVLAISLSWPIGPRG